MAEWLRSLGLRLRALLRRRQLEQDLQDEVAFHLAMRETQLRESGAGDAEVRARRRFGNKTQVHENLRDTWAVAPAVSSFLRDLRYALRSLWKSPGFTLTSITVLALAIGANTAMFSVLNAVLLKPLPYRSPEQLAMVWSEIPSQGAREARSAYANVEQWRSQSKSFADLAVFDPVSVSVTTAAGAEHISVCRVSPNFFPLLGIQPVQGRTFSAAEADERQHLVVIGHQFWITHFGGSPDTIGATVDIQGVPSRIIGILPATSRFSLLDADVWEPHTLFPDWEVRRGVGGERSWLVVGRLRPNVTFDQAQSEMSAIASHLDRQRPASDRNRGVSVVPLSQQLTDGRSRSALWMLTGAVFCVLLIAATNVASLSLARSVSREKEIAIRAALGASRVRIVRQLLTESVTLAVVSGLLGLLVALAFIRVILAVKPGNLARLNEIGLDPHVLGWSLGLCLLTGIGVGLAPAVTMACRNLTPSGHEGARGSSGGVAARRIRRALVVTEFAFAIILLVGAGLLIRSLRSVQNVDPGFRTGRVLSMQLDSEVFRTGAQRADFYNRVLEQIQSLPDVESAGIIGDLFISGSAEQILSAEGDTRSTSDRIRFRRDEASPGFFTTLGIPLLRGRFFSREDGPGAPPIAIINNAMARRVWPGREAVGKRFKLGPRDSAAPWFTVVGVVGDMRRQGLEREPNPQMFEPLAQNPSRLETLLIRTSADDPVKMAGMLQAAVHQVEKRAPIYGVTTVENRLGTFLTERRFETALLIGFSVVALLMAAIGIYGLVQYSIATRTQEIAIRMAIGAQTGEIVRMIIREGLKLSLTGLVLGLAGALWLGRAVSSLLFGVAATDPLTFTAVSLLLTAVATAACYFPARRAMKIQPIVALRQG